MSIKDLFSNKPTGMESANSASVAIESPDLVEALRRQREEIVPPIDFLSASNFVRFGSAKEYYAESIKRVYNYYPYDGSQKEKIEFDLSSSYLDRYIFNYKYPKHVGYAQFSADSYIQINRGYNKATVPTSTKLSKLFQNNDPYHDSDNRKKQSFVFDLDDGVTIEWWMKKDGFGTDKETFFELISSNVKMDLVLTGTTEPIKFYASSSAEISLSTISEAGFESTDLTNDTWAHYAVSISNTTTNTIVDFYRNGVRKKQNSFTKISTPIGNITGFLASGSYGLLSASVDEFRYWNKKQTSESIYNNYISGINGGGNTDDYRKEISVYFKFNEGKTEVETTDKIVLDYSGRLSNGYWHNYVAANRQSGSYTSSEVADPIVRSDNPLVQSLLTEMQTSGSTYDSNSKMQLYDLVPTWIRDEDEKNGEELKHIIQIISSYFDTLYAQIEFLPNIKNKHYYQDDEKPMPFIRRILEDRGLLVSDILINRTIVEYFQKKDLNGIQYEKDIEILKNRIYHNIYNNLEYIYKTKGTEKSYRNMLRCFGIDDELVKLNLYTDNGTQYLVDKTKHTSQKTKHIDFDDPDNFSSTVYQQGHISGSNTGNYEKNNAITLEVEMLVPKKPEESSVNFYNTSFISSSVFGLDAVDLDTSAYVSTTNLNNFQVYLVRDTTDSARAKWVVEQTNHSAGTSTVVASSDFYEDIYDNQRWNVAVKAYPVGYPFAGSFATSSSPGYKLELYGVTHNFDEVLHEFSTTASLSYADGVSLLSAHKKVYVGARRTNWSGSILAQSDLKIAACSLYYDKLDAVSIKQHNLDPSNYGHNRVFGNPTPFLDSATNTHLPAQHSLALHWDFQTVTGSDSSGQFTVEDFSSASVDGRYGWLGNIVVQEHKGTGFGFPVNNTSLVKNEFVFASKKELPEISFTSDNVTVVGDDDVYLYEDEDVNDNIFAFEKSMYQVVSQEMLNMFTTMIEYSNMFAKPVDRYRFSYKRLAHARKLFFEKTSTDLNLDRFTEYYKWIDSSISFFLEQLHPSNAKFNKGITETIESHILERPKYQHILPNIEEHKTIKEQPARGIGELTYNWKSGHAPAPGEAAYTNDNLNCLWRKEREKRTGTNATQREQLKTVISSDTYVEEIPSFGTSTGTTYQGSTYGLRRFSRPHKLSIGEQKIIHGGINYDRAKDRDLLKAVIPRHGNKNSLGIPTDVVVLGVGPGQGLLDNQACEERNQNPNYKEKYGTIAIVGKYSNFDGSSPVSGSGIVTVTQEYAYNLKGQRIFPFNMVSGNISTGYNALISSSYYKDVYLTNLHSDTTDRTNEIPMQGPFTKTWVGGRQSRHIALNTGEDNQYTRPEEWRMLIGDHPDSADQDGAMGLTGPDYGGPYPDPTRQSAVHYRDGRAKRPLNIQNVQTTGNVKGNYDEKYEVLSIVGRKENNLKFREFEPIHNFLPTQLGNALPQTTNLLTLASIAPSSSGNVWGVGESNRINSFENVLKPGVLASGSFTLTGATVYKAAYTGSFNVPSIPFQGLHQSYHFQVSGATDYYEIYSGSFDVQPVPHAGTHQTYYFQATGSYFFAPEGIYTGSFQFGSPPRMPKNQTYYFKATGSHHASSILTGSFQVAGTPYAGVHQTQYFTVTGSTHNSTTDAYVGSFAKRDKKTKEQHAIAVFNVKDIGNLTEGNYLDITLDSTTKRILADTNASPMTQAGTILMRKYRFYQCVHLEDYQLQDETFSGLNPTSNGLTISFWAKFPSGEINANRRDWIMAKDSSDSQQFEILVYQNTLRWKIKFSSGHYWVKQLTSTATNALDDDNWHHFVFTTDGVVSDYTDGAAGFPNHKIYVDNVDMTTSLQYKNLTSNKTTSDLTSTISKMYIGDEDLDWKITDLAFWKTYFDSTDVGNLYNGGAWKDHSTHAEASDLVSWYTFSNYYWDTVNYILDDAVSLFGGAGGNQLVRDGGSPSIDADDPYVDSYSTITDAQMWDKLKYDLSDSFVGYTTQYSEQTTLDGALFFIRKDAAGSITRSLTYAGTTFANPPAGSSYNNTDGALSYNPSGDLTDGDQITLSGSVFTIRTTTKNSPGSIARDFTLGTSYRKALKILHEPSALYNDNYTDPSSTTYASISFWAKIEAVSGDYRLWEFDKSTTVGGTDNSQFSRISDADIEWTLYRDASTSSRKFTVSNAFTSDDVGTWKHLVFVWHRENWADQSGYVDIYIDGVSKTVSEATSVSAVTAPTPIRSIAIGSDDGTGDDPQSEGMQDFCIWNTQLDADDIHILYNSGSWLNIHSHPKAYLLWDWWMLGEEAGMPSVSSTLNSAGVSSIAPTIGTHTLSITDNSNITVTNGTLETARSAADFGTEIVSVIESQTGYSAYTTGAGNTINMAITSSHDVSDAVSSTDDSFFNETAFAYSNNVSVSYVSGAVHGNQLNMASHNFTITTSSATPTYSTDSSATVYVNSTSSQFFNYLQQAMEYHLDYTVGYFENDNQAYFFARRETLGSPGYGNGSISGDTFSDLGYVAGQTAKAATNLEDGDTITVSGSTFTVRHGTSGSAVTDINTGTSLSHFRQAFRFASTGTASDQQYLYNSSYVGPDGNLISFSFWMYNDSVSNDGNILNGRAASGRYPIQIFKEEDDLFIKLRDSSNNYRQYKATGVLSTNTWKHFAFSTNRGTGIEYSPLLTINGVNVSLTADGGTGTGAYEDITKVYIGDWVDADHQYELQGALADFIIWQKYLVTDDAKVLYNSGSWVDTRTHPSASLIWDWWELGAPNGTYTLDQSLTNNSISSVPQTVGRNALSLGPTAGNRVFVVEGPQYNVATNSTFNNYIAEKIEANTGYSASVDSNTINLNLTSSDFSVHHYTDSLTDVGDTFLNQNTFALHSTSFISGAAADDQIQIEDEIFIVSTSSSPSTFASSSVGISVNSTGSEFWNYLSGAIEQYLPEYTASYFVHNNEAQFFVRNGTAGNEPNDTLTATGTTFTDTETVLGDSSNYVPVVIQDGDSISVDGTTFTVKYTTKGSAATDFIAGGTYRKALHFNTSDTTATMALTNTSYTPTTDPTAVSVSFWLNKYTSTTGHIVVLGDGPYTPDGIFINYESGKLKVEIGNGTSRDIAFDITLGLNQWKHATLTVYKDLTTNPKLWIDGVLQSVDGGYTNVTSPSTLTSQTKIAIGDYNGTSLNYELQGALQDFVVWNTELTNEDAAILYNSGSWLDMPSHPSASSIWDWWSFDSYHDGYSSGSTLQTNGVSSISPTIGRHALTVEDNTKIIVTDGIYMVGNSIANWINTELVGKIESQTNYSASLDGGGVRINLEQTSSAVISDSLNFEGITFSNKNVVDLDRLTGVQIYLSGAVPNNQLKIEDEVFIVSTSSSPSTWASGSGGISVNSTGSEFWNYLSGAIEQYLPQYTASYYVHNNQAQFFVRNGESGSQPNDSLDTYSGATWNGAGLVLGSDMSASSNLADGDTLALDGDTFNLRYTTSGSAATDFMVGTQYRKAFNWKKTDGTNKISLKNVSFDDTDLGSVISLSFWVKFDQDSGGYTQYIFQGLDSSGDSSIVIQRLNEDFEIDHFSNAGYVTHNTTGDDLPTGKWLSVSIKIDTSNIDTAPVVYVNGQQKSITSGTAVGGAARGLGRIYIGDSSVDTPFAELQGSLQDFVIWNTGLGSQDATILYNSGSWLDIHSHPSASSIWDWWEFSGSVSGSAISSVDNSITSVAPTVGRHTLVYDDDTSGNVFVTDGIVDDKKTSSAFKTHVADVIRSQTAFSASVSSILLEVTAAVDIHSTGSFSTPGTTFTSLSGIEFVKYGNYYSGSIGLDQIEFEGKTFIVSASTTPSSTHTIVGDNVYVYSHQNEDTTWWNNLTGAIQAALPTYTASYFQSGTMGHFFARNALTGSNAHSTITETGDSFWYPYMATGSNTSGSSTLVDQNTLVITDNTGSTTYTVGHTTSGSAARYINTGLTHRKAFHFKDSTNNKIFLNNDSYSNPDNATAISISFWLRKDAASSGYALQLGGTTPSNTAVAILFSNNYDFYIGNGTSYSTAFTNSITLSSWNHYTLLVHKNLSTNPKLWVNGQEISLGGSWSSPGGTLGTIGNIVIGDRDNASGLEELQGSIQDFVIWNTGLDSQDAKILYNSGSWLDIHSHPSASSIWDWWMLGEEGTHTSGSNLTSNSISSVAPTVGRHILDLGADAATSVFITDGIKQESRTNVNFWNNLTQSIKDNTEFNQSYVTSSSNLLCNITASTVVTGSMMLQETIITPHPAGTNQASFANGVGTTFGISGGGVTRGPEVLRQQRYVSGGASQGEYFFIAQNFEETTGSYFIIENANQSIWHGKRPNYPGGILYKSLTGAVGVYRDLYSSAYTNYFPIISSASTNQEFWNNVTSAIETAYPNYNITTASYSANECTFMITGTLATTHLLTDVNHVDNRIASTGKKKFSISAPSSSTSTNSFLYNGSVTGYGTTGGMSLSFWLKSEVDKDESDYDYVDRFLFDAYDSSYNRALKLRLKKDAGASVGLRLHFDAYTNNNIPAEWAWSFRVSPGDRLQQYGTHCTLTWDGNFAQDPKLYLNGTLQSDPTSLQTTTGTTRETIQKIYMLNQYATNKSSTIFIGTAGSGIASILHGSDLNIDINSVQYKVMFDDFAVANSTTITFGNGSDNTGIPSAGQNLEISIGGTTRTVKFLAGSTANETEFQGDNELDIYIGYASSNETSEIATIVKTALETLSISGVTISSNIDSSDGNETVTITSDAAGSGGVTITSDATGANHISSVNTTETHNYTAAFDGSRIMRVNIRYDDANRPNREAGNIVSSIETGLNALGASNFTLISSTEGADPFLKIVSTAAGTGGSAIPISCSVNLSAHSSSGINFENTGSVIVGQRELMGSLNDFIFWETELNQQDVDLVHNSGSWYDVTTHTSASSIRNWWQLGSEEAVATKLVPGDPVPVNTVFTASISKAHGGSDTDNNLTASQGLFTSLGFADYTQNTSSYFAATGITGGLDQVVETGLLNVVQRENENITASTRQKSIIASRFSAPGGVEVQTYGYLDAYAHEYSVHNSLNFRNQPVKSDSGEAGTMRVNSHSRRREGLNTLYRRHAGKFGTDSTYGAVSSNTYDSEASFHKVHRNVFTKPIVKSKALKKASSSDGLVSINASVSTLQYKTTGPISVSFWLKLDGDGILDRTIYSGMNGTDFAQRLFIKNGLFYWFWYDSAGNTSYTQVYFYQVGVTYESLQQWNHFAFVWDGDDTDNNVGIYINGVSHSIAGGVRGDSFASAGVRRALDSIHLFDLGNGSTDYELQGALQEFITWDKVLDQTDVTQIYNNGNYFDARNSDSQGDILDYWTLGRGEEFDAFDYGSFIPNGFVINSIHGTSRTDLTTNSTYEIVGGFYNTSDESKPTRKDNYFIQSSLPSSDYNYSWVTSSLGNNYNVRSGTQKVFGYWPKNGVLSSSSGFDTAITFPTASDIQGS